MDNAKDEKEPVELKKEEKEPETKEEKCESEDPENLDEDTEIVTMVDVLKEETELEDNADAGK